MDVSGGGMPVVSSRSVYCASVAVYRAAGRKLVRALLASHFYGTTGQGRPVTLKDLFIGAVLVGVTFAGVVAAASALQDGDDNTATFQQVSNRARLVGGGTPPLTSGLLAGRPAETSPDAPSVRRPIAVMIDNNSAAVPQTGLNRADVVIEALVEGGITRFLAIFHSQEAVRIEPVRSARTPFLRWVLEYDALFAHVGSSEESGDADAGRQIREWNVSDLDYQGARPVAGAFARDSAREPPHNVYTNTPNLRRSAESRGYNRAPTFQPWKFTPKPPGSSAARSSATRLTVGFGSLSPFTVGWTWDANTRLYRRSEYGAPHFDAATSEQLTASNVIVQYARSFVADSLGHVLIDNIGQGQAQLFMDGTVTEAIWRKAENASRTRFYSQTGLEIEFRPGQTWIEVVDPSGGVRID
ncbi:MAG: DUF3048 domain-containing protein [Anaerolineaceae bacterium]